MAGTITAYPEPSNVPPRFRLEVAGAAGAAVTITRQNSDGTNYQVRTADPATLTAGAATIYDYETPHSQSGVYSYATDTGETGTVAVARLIDATAVQSWLIHPGVPALSMPLHGVTVGDRTRSTLQGTHNVLGRPAPVTVTDGTRRLPTATLTCKTYQQAEEDALLALLDDVSPLLLQELYPFTARCRYWWVSVGDVTQAEITGDFGEQYLKWTLPITVTDRPAGLLQAERTYSDLLADFASYAYLDAAFATYHDVLINNPL